MFVPPSFEPNTPCEPQWFPRPITDSIESSVDLLERLEEDRKRRLAGIANVSAITPIGLGGCEDRHSGSSNHSSPTPRSGNNHDYSKYRYYPPAEDIAASLHTSYQKKERLITPSNVSTRQNKVQRNYNKRANKSTTPRSTTSSSFSSAATATTPASNDRAFNMDNSRLHSSRIVRSANNNTSTGEQSATSPFMSPRLDPRAGGGGGGGGGYYSSSTTAGYYSTAAGRSGRPTPYHYQRRQSPEEEEAISTYTINTAATPTAGGEEYVTPPAMSTAEQQLQQTNGHGVSDDVYSQRREASQRGRRRRGWDEING